MDGRGRSGQVNPPYNPQCRGYGLKISGSMGVLLAVLSAALQLGIVQGGVPLTC